MSKALRVLVVHADLHSRLFECSEMWQYLSALSADDRTSELELFATDCRQLYRVAFREGIGRPVDPVPLVRALGRRFHVAAVFGTLPWYQVVVAGAARLTGARIVLFPLVLLTSDFTRRSWYLSRGALFRRLKPYLVRTLGFVWRRLATVICCASQEEVRQSTFPVSKVVFLPWPRPDTPLAAFAAQDGAGSPHPKDGQGPLALVSRLDPWRKGFDRTAAWLEAHRDTLPRPALLLLAPYEQVDDPSIDRLLALQAEGLIEWDVGTTGVDLARRLRACRGVALLSRWDGQPRALREALLLGLPIVTTASTHLSEVVELLHCGVVVDGDDPDAIQSAFVEAADLDVPLMAVRSLFSAEALGAFLVDVLRAGADGRLPEEPSYYEGVRTCLREGRA